MGYILFGNLVATWPPAAIGPPTNQPTNQQQRAQLMGLRYGNTNLRPEHAFLSEPLTSVAPIAQCNNQGAADGLQQRQRPCKMTTTGAPHRAWDGDDCVGARALGWARDGGSVAACADLSQSWTLSMHLPMVASQLAAVGPEVQPLQGEPGYTMGLGLEIRSVRLPSPMVLGLLDGFCFTRGDGAEVWKVVHHQLPESWDVSPRPRTAVGCWVSSGRCGRQTARVHPW